MATLSYFTIAGQTRCRTTAGGRFEEYLSDALGSTICVPQAGAAVARQSRYTPYGQEYFNNGVFTAPRLGWVGRLGYWATPLRRAESYIRARHYDNLDGRWTSIDLLWPYQSPYTYGESSPGLFSDPSGMSACSPDPCKSLGLPPGAGITLCGGGTCTICFNPPPGAPPGLKACVDAHENVHCNDMKSGKDTVYCGNCGSVMCLKNKNPSKAECPAITAGLKCLSGKFPNPCANPRSFICREIQGECLQLGGYVPYGGDGKLQCKPIDPKVKSLCKSVGVSI